MFLSQVPWGLVIFGALAFTSIALFIITIYFWIQFQKYWERAGRPGTVFLGKLKDKKTRAQSDQKPPSRLYLSHEAREQHVWIKGNTGMGKSTFIDHMAMEDIDDDIPVIYMDFKADIRSVVPMIKRLHDRDETHRLCYTSISMGEDIQRLSMNFNPFADFFESGKTNDPQPVMEMLNKSVKAYLGESLYHRQEAEKLVERFVYAAAYSGKKINMEDIYLGVSKRRVREDVFKICSDFLKEHGTSQEISEVKGILESESNIKDTWDENDWKEKTHRVSSQIDSLNRGDLGEHLNTYIPEVSIREVLANDLVWLIQAPVSKAPQHTIFMYNMILQSLHGIATELRRSAQKQPVAIYVDDFPYAMTGTLVQHLRQSGQAGMMFHVGTQEEQAEDLPGLEQSQAQDTKFFDQFGNKVVFKTEDDNIVQKFTSLGIKEEVKESQEGPDGETTTQTREEELFSQADFKMNKGEAIVDIDLEDDFPHFPFTCMLQSMENRRFPAVGKYKMNYPSECHDDTIESFRDEALEILGERKKEVEADRKVKRDDADCLELAKRVEGERDSLWDKN